MTHSVNCPNCGIKWKQDISITEYFHKKYEQEGVPSYIREKGVVDPFDAAVSTGEMYGCVPDSPKHFSINVVGIEDKDRYDGVSYWQCEACDVVIDRFTEETVN